MMNLSKADANFQTTFAQEGDFTWYFPSHKDFVLEGLPFCPPDGPYERIAPDLLPGLSGELRFLSHHTSGAALRFSTDSRQIALQADLHSLSNLSNMAKYGECGFDLYCYGAQGYQFLHTFSPAVGEASLAESWNVPDSQTGCTEFLLYFPLYCGVQKLRVGLLPDARFGPLHQRALPSPILFYGSSITQGASAGRPGSCYPAAVCRALDAPLVNLGFSGNAKGDLALAQQTGRLTLSAFVMDYDYNAPCPAFLARTHQPFFQAVRQAQPDLPVLLLSRVAGNPDFAEDTRQRREIIQQTYAQAKAAGDEHVAFLDGEAFWAKVDPRECTMDLCHPNDLGFFLMAKHILPALQQLLRSSSPFQAAFSKCPNL